jgi:chromosome segregation ATPase
MFKDVDEKLDYIQNKIDEMSTCVNKIDKEVALHKASFDEHIKQDERMYEEFKRMNDILQQNTDSLKEHMRRTDLLEDIVQRIDVRLSPLEKHNIESKAVEKYRKESMVKIAKILGILGTIVGAMAALWPIIFK